MYKQRAVPSLAVVDVWRVTAVISGKQEILLSEDLRSIRLLFMIKEAYKRSHECYFARIFYSH